MNKNAVNSVCALFALLIATIVYFTVGNWWYVGSSFILALLLSMALRPSFAFLFDRKKPTDIAILRERGFEHGTPIVKVLYVLILTQGVVLDVKVPEQRAVLEDIFERSAAAFSEKYEFFRNRYADTLAKERALKIGVSSCDHSRSGVGKCYRSWIRLTTIDNNIPPREDVDIFFNDIDFTDPEGQTRSAVVAAQFYRW